MALMKGDLTMKCTHFRSTFASSDGEHRIAYYVYFPVGEVKGVVQIVHGMIEHIRVYEHFAQYLTGLGYLVCGNDHLGHGASVNDESEFGYFSPENGWQNCIHDMYKLTTIIKKSYPDVPYYIFCHSMGSFLGRAYAVKHRKTLDGIVISGTSGGVSGVPGLLTLSAPIKKAKGEYHRSKTLTKLAFGKYNDKIDDNSSPKDWVTRDREMLAKFDSDPTCNFVFTVNGFENLSKLLWFVSQDKWYQNYPKDLPTLLIAGTADPVADYGSGVKKVFEKLFEQGCNVEMKLYEDARHSLVHEPNRDEIMGDIASFLGDLGADTELDG